MSFTSKEAKIKIHQISYPQDGRLTSHLAYIQTIINLSETYGKDIESESDKNHFFDWCKAEISTIVTEHLSPLNNKLRDLHQQLNNLVLELTLDEEGQISPLPNSSLFSSHSYDNEKYSYQHPAQSLLESIKQLDLLEQMHSYTTEDPNPLKKNLPTILSINNDTLSLVKNIKNSAAEKLENLYKFYAFNSSFHDLDTDAKVISSYIRHREKNIDPAYLAYIVDHISIQKISAIFNILSERKDLKEKNIYTTDQLKAAQTAIYTAITHSIKLKLKAAGRIALAVIAAFILTPVSLYFTVPWIVRRKEETLLEKRRISKTDHQRMKKIHKKYYAQKSQNSLFNIQGELKSLKKDLPNEKIEVIMAHAQAARFDHWKKMLKNVNLGIDTHHQTFFDNSKTASKQVIEQHTSRILRK